MQLQYLRSHFGAVTEQFRGRFMQRGAGGVVWERRWKFSSCRQMFGPSCGASRRAHMAGGEI
jgi:hypothetical protein